MHLDTKVFDSSHGGVAVAVVVVVVVGAVDGVSSVEQGKEIGQF